MAPDLIKDISGFIDLDPLLDFFFDKINEISEFDYSHIFLYDEDFHVLKLFKCSYPAFYAKMMAVTKGMETPIEAKGFEQECFASKKPLVFYDQNIKQSYNEGFKLNFENRVFKSTLGFPIRLSKENSIGVLLLYSEEKKIEDNVVKKIDNLIKLMHPQIKTCCFIDRMQKQLDEVSVFLTRNKKIANLSSEVNFLGDKETIYRTFMEKLMQVFEFQIASVQLKQGDFLPIIATAWTEEKYKAYPLAARQYFSIPENTHRIDPKEGASAVAFLNNCHFYFEDIQELKTLSMTPKDQKGMDLIEKFYPNQLRTILIVPIRERNLVTGILQLWSFKNAVYLNGNDIEIVKNVCSFISTTVKNSELYQQLMEKNRIIELKNKQITDELKLAKKIQQTLIPTKLPKVHGLKFAKHYQPMEEVGGDFFDILEEISSKGELGIFISDVSGHGVPAALVASMLKSFLETSGKYRKKPAKLLAYLNEKLEGLTGGNFLTAFYAVFNPQSKKLLYSRASHNYPVLIRNGELRFLEGQGKILGIMPDLDFEELEISLEKGDKIIFYTDGLTEAMNEEDEEFEESFYSILKNDYKLNIQDLNDKIVKELIEFSNNKAFEDDVCIVSMQLDY